GIGTTNPGAKLDVTGDIKASDRTGVGRYLYLANNQTSDPADAPEGSLYYDTTRNVFRCKGETGWFDCSNTSLGPWDGPWVKLPNLFTNAGPTEKTILYAETINCSGVTCTLNARSPWQEFVILNQAVKAIRVKNGTTTVTYRVANGNTFYCTSASPSSYVSSSGAVNIADQFTGIAATSPVAATGPSGTYRLLLSGTTPGSPPEGGNNLYDFKGDRASVIYPATIVSGNQSSGVFEGKEDFFFGISDFEFSLLTNGERNYAAEGVTAGKYWNDPGINAIPAGSHLRVQTAGTATLTSPYADFGGACYTSWGTFVTKVLPNMINITTSFDVYILYQ
ncbi:hypothetical protein HY546_03380, partial [archaeon]|nr:hypothetical protein [archaeon]